VVESYSGFLTVGKIAADDYMSRILKKSGKKNIFFWFFTAMVIVPITIIQIIMTD
jgi:hypothetical protein